MTTPSGTPVHVTPGSRLGANADIVTREIVGETLLVPITGKLANLQEIFSLNETGAFVWSNLDGQRTVAEVSAALAAEFDVTSDEALADVVALSGELAGLGMLDLIHD